jgi:hypothetical protein
MTTSNIIDLELSYQNPDFYHMPEELAEVAVECKSYVHI